MRFQIDARGPRLTAPLSMQIEAEDKADALNIFVKWFRERYKKNKLSHVLIAKINQ